MPPCADPTKMKGYEDQFGGSDDPLDQSDYCGRVLYTRTDGRKALRLCYDCNNKWSQGGSEAGCSRRL